MSDFVRNLLNYLTELGSGIVMKVLLGLVIIFVGMKLCKWLTKNDTLKEEYDVGQNKRKRCHRPAVGSD